MGIRVEHQPVDAMYALSKQAGSAEYEKNRQAQQDKLQLGRLQREHEMRKMQFMEAAQQRARAEEMQYQMSLVQAKRQIDLQTEASDYARQKQLLNQTLNMINDSDEFSEEEKQRLRVQATSKYADVGTGITSASFKDPNANAAMTTYAQKGAFRMGLINDLQRMTESDQMDPYVAQNIAAGQQISGVKFYGPGERGNELIDQSRKRLAKAQSDLEDSFRVEGNKVKDAYGNKIDKDNPKMEMYRTLQRQVQDAKRELDSLTSRKEDTVLIREFQEVVRMSPSAQKLLQQLGPEEAYRVWKENRNKTDDEKLPFSKRHPILTAISEISPAVTVHNLVRGKGSYER